MRRTAILLLALLALLPTGAATATAAPVRSRVAATSGRVTMDPAVSADFATRALAGVHYDWWRLGYVVDFHAAARPQRAITDNTAGTIDLYLRAGQSVQLTSKILAYEFGHAVDFQCNTLARRVSWLRLRGAPSGTHWWAPDGAPEWSYGSGDFADVFSLWATGSTLGYVSQVAPRPSRASLARLAGDFDCRGPASLDYRAP